jgi:hypothetical protein
MCHNSSRTVPRDLLIHFYFTAELFIAIIYKHTLSTPPQKLYFYAKMA